MVGGNLLQDGRPLAEGESLGTSVPEAAPRRKMIQRRHHSADGLQKTLPDGRFEAFISFTSVPADICRTLGRDSGTA